MTDTEQPGNLILRYLRRIDENIAELREDMREVKRRLSLVEESQAIVSRRLDRLEDRVERIEKRSTLPKPDSLTPRVAERTLKELSPLPLQD